MAVTSTKGASSSQGYGEFLAASGVNPNAYIENLFSTWLYKGTGANQTITNNINLSGNGGLVWIKDRSNANNHNLFDTAQGATKFTHSNLTDATATDAVSLTSFNADGFSVGTGNTAGSQVNTNPDNFASWTFRKQAKFFDIVTYTGTGAAQNISHNLGSTPGCIIVKRTDTTSDWQVYHGSLANTQYLVLNTTAVPATGATRWNSTTPTSTVFSVGTDASVNASGGTYVAYVFASNAGGFGNAGTDNVITCGGFTADGSGNATVSLGYEPQWILVKRTSSSTDWHIYDTMRGWTVNSSGVGQQVLYPDLTSPEGGGYPYSVNSTGFGLTGVGGGNTFVYIAIRRGPMKTPTTGTSVFNPVLYTSTVTSLNTGIVADLSLQIQRQLVAAVQGFAQDRLRGTGSSGQYQNMLATSSTNYETAGAWTGSITDFGLSQYSVSMQSTNTGNSISGGNTYVDYFLQRAPGFFDEVCYTGTGSATTQAHNLGVAPELMIVKERSASNAWQVYSATLANTQYLVLNTTAAAATGATRWNSTTPTSSVFSIGTDSTVNASTKTYAAYLFASCPGVSKVGTYSGTGATQTINCGFTGGARFVLIKRTDSTGDWYVWDTARGMVAGTDPYSLLNSQLAETNANNVYTTTGGFQIVSSLAGINASGGTYLFLAIA